MGNEVVSVHVSNANDSEWVLCATFSTELERATRTNTKRLWVRRVCAHACVLKSSLNRKPQISSSSSFVCVEQTRNQAEKKETKTQQMQKYFYNVGITRTLVESFLSMGTIHKFLGRMFLLGKMANFWVYGCANKRFGSWADRAGNKSKTRTKTRKLQPLMFWIFKKIQKKNNKKPHKRTSKGFCVRFCRWTNNNNNPYGVQWKWKEKRWETKDLYKYIYKRWGEVWRRQTRRVENREATNRLQGLWRLHSCFINFCSVKLWINLHVDVTQRAIP